MPVAGSRGEGALSAVVLDTGALIALDRDQRRLWAVLRAALDDGSDVVVPTGVIAQAWRDGARQVLLARALSRCEDVPLDALQARAAGILCAVSSTADVIDASVAIVAASRTRSGPVTVVTSDPDDIAHLAGALRCNVRIVTP